MHLFDKKIPKFKSHKITLTWGSALGPPTNHPATLQQIKSTTLIIVAIFAKKI